jgi:hypothetical protein
MSVIYKILCDVKLMHEFYLTESKGETVFDLPSQQLRLDFLLKQFLKKIPDIGDDLSFVFPDSLLPYYKGYHLKVLHTYSGFKIAVGCRKKLQADGTVVFEPIASLPADLEIIIALKQKTSVNQFSQRSSRIPFQAGWYFANDIVTGARTFPFLSGPVNARDNAVQYVLGDVAEAGGSINIFLDNGAVDPWKPLSGNGYASDADQLLVPLQFTYYFTEADQMLDALFILKNSVGTEVTRITKTAGLPFRNCWLNFNPGFATPLRTVTAQQVTSQSIYTLEVSGTNGYNRMFRLLFADPALPLAQYAGLVNIKPFVANPDFRLQHADGHLPLTDVGGNARVPVYEIWLKSKMVFLKYQHNHRKKLKLSAATTGLLADAGGILISENPVSLSYQPVSYKKQDASFQLIPNPGLQDDVQITNNKSFVQMMVPDSAIFPLL